jgi:oxygen-dependent protoporphyrinogen oxidase
MSNSSKAEVELPQSTTRGARRVVVVGGGIAGLSAAWYTVRQSRAAGQEIECTVLEAGDRWGGKVLTEQIEHATGAYTLEGGPDSFISQKPWAAALARELGMGGELIGTNDASRKVYVVNRGRPVPLPDGVLLIVPTKFKPFALSRLISPIGKLRMGMDLFIPPRRDGADETLAEFVRRRLGDEALDKIAEPLLSGIYNAEADRQSLLATFPRFRALEEQHGSLTRGILSSRRKGHGKPQNGTGTGTGPTSAFLSLRRGAGQLIEGLVAALSQIADLRTDTRVTGLAHNGQWTVSLDDDSSIAADAVILALPAFVAADLVRPHAREAAELMDSIRYVGTGTVSLAYRAADLAAAPVGFGVVVPRSERRPINAITFSSVKFDHRAPEGYALLRVFFGGSRSPQSMELSDVELLATVRRELAVLAHIDAEPLFHRIHRWPRSNPQYDVGHLDRVVEIEKHLPPGLYVTGSPFRGVGLPDCVKQAQETAGYALTYLKTI